MTLPAPAIAAAIFAALLSLHARAATPLAECDQTASGRLQVRACLERMTKTESAALVRALADARARMEKLDRAAGSANAVRALEESQRAFLEFRERNCAWIAATLSPGTGAGDAALDCMIRMDRARADELRTLPAAAVSRAAPTAGGVGSFTGVEWHLTQLVFDGAATGLGFTETPVSIRFDESGQAAGRGPINRFNASYSSSADGRIGWTGAGLQTTNMAGPPEAMEKEDMFFQILGQVYRYRVSGSRLILETEDANSSLVFEYEPLIGASRAA